MGVKEELLRAVREEPEDMAPRVALADWLQENAVTEADSAYGEYLALCARLLQIPEGAPGRVVLDLHRQQLLEEHQRTWLGPLVRVGDVVQRPDGLVALTGYNMAFVARQLPALESATEFTWVAECGLRICGGTLGQRDLSDLAKAPCLCHLTALHLQDNAIDAEGIQRLTESPHLGTPVELHLGGNVLGTGGVRLLASCPRLARLRVLDLSRNGLAPEAAHVLAQWAHGARLDRLSLWGNRLGERGAQALAAAPALANLTGLDLGDNALGDLGVGALAASPYLARLAVLDLRNNAITSEGVRALLGSPHLTALRQVPLWGNSIGDDVRPALRERFGRSRLVEWGTPPPWWWTASKGPDRGQEIPKEVTQSLDHPTRERVEEELRDLGLHPYCRDAREQRYG
jgi:uncharacterized protein (TIGR02996 family)